MKKKKQLEEAHRLIRSLNDDAHMALSGEWNKSDSGFDAQIELIEEYCKKYNVDIEYMENEDV